MPGGGTRCKRRFGKSRDAPEPKRSPGRRGLAAPDGGFREGKRLMRIVTIMAAMALSTGVIGASAATAGWHHPKKHKVCRTSWHNHHRVTHCVWR